MDIAINPTRRRKQKRKNRGRNSFFGKAGKYVKTERSELPKREREANARSW